MTQKITAYNPTSTYNLAIKKLSENGIRPTKQRILLANLLMGDGKHQHFTAEDLFEKAKIYHTESFNSGEPQKKSKYFLKK